MRRIVVVVFACVVLPSLARLMTWEPDDYVQDGLVAHFDGIRNAGAMQSHDPNAKIWQDLKSANCFVFSGTSDVAIATGSWTGGNSYSFAYSYGHMKDAIDLGKNITVQLVLDAGFEMQDSEYGATKVRAAYPTYVGITNDFGVFGRYNYDNGYIEWKNTTWCGERAKCAGWDGRYMNLITTDGSSYLGSSAAYENGTARTKQAPFDGYQWSLGGAHYPDSAVDVDRRLALSRYYSARFYNRPLTVQELERNRRIDEVRFGGIVYTNVVVAASGYAGVSGAEAAGIYAVDSEHTFTAENVTVGDVTYAAGEYTLEAWNGSSWGTAQVFEGSSYTYTVTEDSPAVRLTWLWKPVRGIRQAVSYDAGDYVQGGLVAQYDGVRNVGAGLPHDPAAEVWRDIKSGNYMTFNGTSDVAVATGGWSGGNAYCFAGYSYAHMAQSISLGSNITFQLAMDIDNAAQIEVGQASNPTYISAKTDYGVFSKPKVSSQTKYCQWKSDTWTGSGASVGRAYCHGWGCRYLTGVTTDELAYLLQTADYTTNSTVKAFKRTKFLAFDELRWSVGGAHYETSDTSDGNINDRLTRGLYHSVRFYNRPLRTEELAWNRKVDEIRFNGAIYTNVIVRSSRTEVSGAQPDGVYEVIEEGCFRANTVVREHNGSRVVYEPVGYTLERLENGVWSNPDSYEGTNYVHSVVREPGAVRLTWLWHRKVGGLNIVIR